MKKILLILILVFMAAPVYAFTSAIQGVVSSSNSGTDYCSSQSWATFSAFKFDFDHTTNNLYACLASGTTTGTLVNAASGQIDTPTPSTTGIGSGGDALITDATTEYVRFTNSSSIFQSQYGELMFKVYLAGDNTADYYLLNIIKTPAEERLQISIVDTGQITITWEDNNHGSVYAAVLSVTYDFDSNYGGWAQIHVQWDTTRCTAGGTSCGISNSDDELRVRIRYDSNNDGDFSDGTAETWSNWGYETSNIDMGTWSSEPTTDTIAFGLVSGTFAQAIWVDDLEISNAKPSW